MAADIVKLMQLVYYAIDKVSPYRLAIDPKTNTLEKLANRTLTSLAISDQDNVDMWQIINTYAKPYAGGGPVAPDDQKDCKTVQDVWNATCKVSGVTP